MRGRKSRLPDFKPLYLLEEGDAFNPYDVFKAHTVRAAIARSRKLRAGAKLIWLLFADQCYSNGYDSHSQANLAEMVGLSVDQFQRHFARLKKLRLVHVEPELGKQNFTWLLFHKLFASCSPRTPRTNAVGGTAEMREGVPHNSGTQRNYQRNYQRSAFTSIYDVTGSVVSAAEKPVGNEHRNGTENHLSVHAGAGIDLPSYFESASSPSANGSSTHPAALTPLLKGDARKFWNTLDKYGQRNRMEQAHKLVDRIAAYRSYQRDKDPNVAREARHAIHLARVELDELGFYLVKG